MKISIEGLPGLQQPQISIYPRNLIALAVEGTELRSVKPEFDKLLKAVVEASEMHSTYGVEYVAAFIELKAPNTEEPPKTTEQVVVLETPVTQTATDIAVVSQMPVTTEPAPEAPAEKPVQQALPLTSTGSECMGVVPADFAAVKNRREIVRAIMAKGVTTVDDVIQVCTVLQKDVKVLQHLGDIKTTITKTYETVQAEDAAAHK